ncbi:MAG TPA: phosphopentomutase [Ktedonobacterales bacterium]|jgi:phosphopentomutase
MATNPATPTLDRAVIIVLDGVGVGDAPDAAAYGDAGASSIAHCAAAVGGLALPAMGSMGLGNITPVPGTPPAAAPIGGYGRMAEAAAGKDSTTGHWEMAGVTLTRALPTYPNGFPPDVVAAFERAIGRGTLGNVAASGTEIIQRLGEEHVHTGKPILYTSADSVFQLAAHEEVIPLDDLYHMCETARGLLTGANAVGRVIARPFVGTPGAFTRTPHRRDFSLQPPGPTLLDQLHGAGYETIGIGKIEDLFAERGLSASDHTATNAEGCAATLAWLERPFRGLLFVNLVECDQLWGHRRDPQGYARALAAFDAWLPAGLAALGPRAALFITGDHGVDPTYRGTDHTRECVPLLCAGPAVRANVSLGTRPTFADLGATLAAAFAVAPLEHGTSFAGAIGL